VIRDTTTAATRDVRALAGVLAFTGSAFTHGKTLLRTNQDYRVATDEEETELASNLTIHTLFSVFEDSVNVNIERLELTHELATVLQLHNHPFVAGKVESVKGACGFDFHEEVGKKLVL
jgi:hypothetical protein